MGTASELLLVGAVGSEGPAGTLRSLLTQRARELCFLYTSEEPACVALAERIGDAIWLTPRRHVGLSTPRAWLELLRSHRYERGVAVVPAAALGLPHDVLFDVLRGARCSRWADASAPVLELSLRTE
jgi:hypothetical protein